MILDQHEIYRVERNQIQSVERTFSQISCQIFLSSPCRWQIFVSFPHVTLDALCIFVHVVSNCITSNRNRVATLNYEFVFSANKYLIEGDIKTDPDQKHNSNGDDASVACSSHRLRCDRLWDGGVIPYIISRGLSMPFSILLHSAFRYVIAQQFDKEKRRQWLKIELQTTGEWWQNDAK